MTRKYFCGSTNLLIELHCGSLKEFVYEIDSVATVDAEIFRTPSGFWSCLESQLCILPGLGVFTNVLEVYCLHSGCLRRDLTDKIDFKLS